MSSSENKRSKRRKNKKGSRSSFQTTLQNKGIENGVEISATASSKSHFQLNNTNSTITNRTVPLETDLENLRNGSMKGITSEDCRIMEQQVDMGLVADLDSLEQANPYLGGERCLLCRCERSGRRDGDGAAENEDSTDWRREDVKIPTSIAQLPLWVCSDCKARVEEEQRTFEPPVMDYIPKSRNSPTFYDEDVQEVNFSGEDDLSSVCQCETCNERRAIETQQVQEQQELRNCWLELKQAVHHIYRDAGLSPGEALAEQQLLPPRGEQPPNVEFLRKLVHRLCSHDPHRLYQCLVAQVHLFIVEMRLRLLRQLVSGNQAAQREKSFARALLEEYAKLCTASKQLSPILSDLAKHMKRFNLTWELVNRHLFQSLVYSDAVIHNGLPDISNQRIGGVLRDKCQHESITLLQTFDQEMTVLAVKWQEAQQLLYEFTQEHMASLAKQRVLQKDWEIFSAHWKSIDDQALSKTTSFVQTCPCDECMNSKLSTSHFVPSLLTPEELAHMAEQADGDSSHRQLSSLSNHYSKGSEKNAITSLQSPLANSHARQYTAPSHSQLRHPLQKESSQVVSSSKHTLEVQRVVIGASTESYDTSVCSQNPVSTSKSDSNRPSRALKHHHCQLCLKQNSHRTDHTTHVQCDVSQPCHVCCQNYQPNYANSTYSHSVNNSNYNVSITAPNSPLRHSFVSTSQLNDTSEFAQHWNFRGLTIEEKGQETKLETLSSNGTTEPRPCECHACTQLKDQGHFTVGPFSKTFPLLPSVFPPLPHLGEVGRTGPAKPHIHPHLYNLHAGKSSTVGVQTTKSTQHLTWPLNLDAEAQEMLQRQICLATLGDWDSYENEPRALTHQKYGSCLSSDMYFNPHSSFPSMVSSSVVLDTGKIRNADVIGHCDDSVKEGDYHYSFSMQQSSVSTPSGTAHRSPSLQRSPGSKRHHPNSETACSLYTHEHMGDCFLSGKMSSSLRSIPSKSNSISSKDQQVSSTTNGIDSSTSKHMVNGENRGSHCGEADCESHTPDGEDSVDDSCSEQSSSTSISNHRESRVCDCCYCEVFGHGMAAMAPVSRNYPEMRERLRLKLSKRKAENGVSSKKDHPEPSESPLGYRPLDEVLNYINGTDNKNNAKHSNSKAAKKHRKKIKKAEERAQRKDHDKKEQLSSQNVENEKYEQISTGPCPGLKEELIYEKHIEVSRSDQFVHQKFEAQEKIQQSRKEMYVKVKPTPNGNGSQEMDRKEAVQLSKTEEKQQKQDLEASQPVYQQVILNGYVTALTQDKENNAPVKKIEVSLPVTSNTISSPVLDSKVLNQAGVWATYCKNNRMSKEEDSSMKKAEGSNKNGDIQQLSKLSVRGKKNKKKKNCTDDITCPDEVFLPNYNGLENGELDELERELEDFKRFCMNSVPPAHREKVHVNLKDIVVKTRRPNYGISTLAGGP
ncbi:protein FAM193A-like isoform X1 [Tachypleus tridentatus]|uniref:protein FAM193A-like isoform X1 n=1 Tax=Tachypleus tridentatus TaxID=6853 RepID=UPI003FD5D3B1